MHILHVFKTYYPDSFGGIERTIHAIAKGGLTYGVESEVLSLSPDPVAHTLELDGHMAHKAKLDFKFASTGFSLDVISRFKTLSAKADLVHYHFPWPFMDLLHFIHPPRKPTLVTYHSDIVKQQTLLKVYKPLMHRFLSSVDHIVATSHNYVESSTTLQTYRDKTQVIPIGLATADYPHASTDLLEKWKARFPKPFFLFVGVLRYYKGLHTLIAAAKNVDADIVIVGTGPMESDYKAQVQRAGLTNVHFLGAINDFDKTALLQLCSAFVFPSHLRSEAYGLSLVEAAMFGVPMISCEINTGTSFVNKDGETGIVIAPEDVGALVRAMRVYLENPAICLMHGTAALARYQHELQATKMVERYCTSYAEAMATFRRKSAVLTHAAR